MDPDRHHERRGGTDFDSATKDYSSDPAVGNMTEVHLATTDVVMKSQTMNSHLPSLESFPVEILDPILLEATQFCRHSYDPSVLPGEHSSWLRKLRFKKGLPLICKALYWSGMKALYNDVVLRRMGQIVALANTLRLPDIGKQLCPAIYHMRMDSCPIMETCTDVVRDDLTWILSNCTAIRSFAYHVHPHFPLPDHPTDLQEFGGMFNPTWFLHPEPKQALLSSCGSLHRLRELNLYIDLRLDGLLQGLHNLLQNTPALTALGLIHREVKSVSEYKTTPDTSLHLPVLDKLNIDLSGCRSLKHYICTYWNAPRLRRLTVLLGNDDASSDPRMLLARFGAHLVYVHILRRPNTMEGRFSRELVGELNTTCPVIEHLVLPHSSGYPFKLVIHSRTLRWLDVWFVERRPRASGAPPFDEWDPGFAREAFVDAESDVPALCVARALFAPWGVSWFGPLGSVPEDVPEVCKPNLLDGRPLSPGDFVVHRFPTRWHVQTAQVVLPYDSEEMKDVVTMIAKQRGTSPNEMPILPRWGLLGELSGWEFDQEELRRIHRTLKDYRQVGKEDEPRRTDDDASEAETEEEDKDGEYEDMNVEDVVWTDDEDIEEEYLEWDGVGNEARAESPVAQLGRGEILAAFSRGQTAF